jgi:hypothetical protein
MKQDHKTSRAGDVALSLLVVVVLVAAISMLRPMTTSTSALPAVTLPDPADDPAAAIVTGRSRSVGFSLLGLEFGEVTRKVSVQFYTASGCFDRVTVGDPWPTPVPECASDVSIAGTVAGGGSLPTGESLVVVDVLVTEDCYRSIERGDRWPPPAGACS